GSPRHADVGHAAVSDRPAAPGRDQRPSGGPHAPALVPHLRVLGAGPAGNLDPVWLHLPGAAGGPADRGAPPRRGRGAARGGGLRGGAALGGSCPAGRSTIVVTATRVRARAR